MAQWRKPLTACLAALLSLAAALPVSAQLVSEAAHRRAEATASRLQADSLFQAAVRDRPDKLWKADAPQDVRDAVARFRQRKALSSGYVYGDSVRDLDLRGLSAEQLDVLLLARGFERHDDFIRDAKTGEPRKDGQGRAAPMTVYTHADGGMVRVKPQGEPWSRARPEPHASKSVRWPADGDYRDFAREAFKVDNDGRALPKAPGELANPYAGTPLADAFVDGWGDDAHTDLPAAALSRR